MGAKVSDHRQLEKKDGSRELRSKGTHDENSKKRPRAETPSKVSTAASVNTEATVETLHKRKKIGVPEVNDEQVDKAADRSIEEMGQLIVHVEGVHVEPLQIHAPIIDWYDIVLDNKHSFKITRADDSVIFYSSPYKIFKAVSREDLEELYRIGLKKYGERKGKDFDNNFLLFDILEMMFEPEKVPAKITRFTQVKDWILFENYGVYSLRRGDGVTDYFLVEKEYKHGLNVMMQMLQVKLRAARTSRQALDLIVKITRQIKSIRDEMKIVK